MARKYRRSFSDSRRVLDQLGRTCFYCHGRATTVDHFIPFSHVPDNSDANLVPACSRCNGIAGSKVFDSVAEKQTYILDRLSRKNGLLLYRCGTCRQVTYHRRGEANICPDDGQPTFFEGVE